MRAAPDLVARPASVRLRADELVPGSATPGGKLVGERGIRARELQHLPDLDIGQAHVEGEDQSGREIEILAVEAAGRRLIGLARHHLAEIPCSSTAAKTSP